MDKVQSLVPNYLLSSLVELLKGEGETQVLKVVIASTK